jgi:hypothetical protein
MRKALDGNAIIKNSPSTAETIEVCLNFKLQLKNKNFGMAEFKLVFNTCVFKC